MNGLKNQNINFYEGEYIQAKFQRLGVVFEEVVDSEKWYLFYWGRNCTDRTKILEFIRDAQCITEKYDRILSQKREDFYVAVRLLVPEEFTILLSSERVEDYIQWKSLIKCKHLTQLAGNPSRSQKYLFDIKEYEEDTPLNLTLKQVKIKLFGEST